MKKQSQRLHKNDHYASAHKKKHDDVRFEQPIIKKKFGQHFLLKDEVVLSMIESVTITPETSVLEIGCGDGFLTKAILANTPCKKLLCYEIDADWASHVTASVRDPRLDLRLQNILEVDWSQFAATGPWVILANLPYNITFPILSLIEKHRHSFQEIVVMVQEEVAQKLVATSGRSLGVPSLFYQHRFTMQLLDKIEPAAFNPPPKVMSRLVYMKPIHEPVMIHDEQKFWKFLQRCFASPRQTLKNNLRTTHVALEQIDIDLLAMRAQQLSFAQFLALWKIVNTER